MRGNPAGTTQVMAGKERSVRLDIFAVRNQTLFVDMALLLIRIVVGYAFVVHGSGKIGTPLHWMGPDSPVPAFFQVLAALSEFGGGFALIFGLLTRLGALGIACTMVVAVLMHAFVLGDPFVNLTGGRSFELAAAYLLIALLLIAAGPGRFSLDRKIFGARS
jgi:putative oxidoreductase